MKQYLSTLLALSLICLSLTACKGKNNSSFNSSESYNTSSKATTDIDIDNFNFDLTDNDINGSYNQASSTTVSNDQDIVTITKEGTYIISGNHSQIIVNTSKNSKVQIILNDAIIKNKSGPAIYVKEADKVFITAYDGTSNKILDGADYSAEYTDNNVDGAIFSKADLTINGSGTLQINGEYKCGIVSKDDLIIYGLTLTVTSVGTGIEGKDCVKLSNASLTLNAGTDGIKSTNTEDSERGYVSIDSGTYKITAENDGIQGETVINITRGNFEITTGGGSANSSTSSNNYGWGMWGGNSSTTESESSAKAIKATSLIKITGGTFNISSSDDAIHSNSDAQIDNGKFSISSGDDGIHADDALLINGGELTITKSYEGLEATAVTITGGKIDITASDDGINAAGGNDSSSMGGRPGQNTFNSTSNATITINGGYILVNASGDGVDSNGNISISGGVLLVSGPTNDGNGAFDYDGNATISGGAAILVGSSGMAQTFSNSSSQCSLMYTLSTYQEGGKSVAITDTTGKVIASFLPCKNFNCILISSPSLATGNKYNLCIGGTVSSCDSNGFTTDGSISGYDNSYSVEINSISTTYGSSGGMGNHGGMSGGGMGKNGNRGNKPW